MMEEKDNRTPYAAYEGTGKSPFEAGCPCELCEADRVKRETQEDDLDMLGAVACAYRFEDHPTIRVTWRDGRVRHDLWAVVDGGICLNNDDQWEIEPQPSSRTDEFLNRCRFPLDEALRRAAKVIKENP